MFPRQVFHLFTESIFDLLNTFVFDRIFRLLKIGNDNPEKKWEMPTPVLYIVHILMCENEEEILLFFFK